MRLRRKCCGPVASNVEAVKKPIWHDVCRTSGQEDRTMAPCKAQDHDSLLLAEVLSGQIRSFAFRLNYRVDHEPDFGPRNAVKHFFDKNDL